MTLVGHRPDLAFGARRKRSCGTTVATCVRRRRIERGVTAASQIRSGRASAVASSIRSAIVVLRKKSWRESEMLIQREWAAQA